MATELEIKLEVGDLQKLDCLLCDPMDALRQEFFSEGKWMLLALLLGGNAVFILYDLLLNRISPVLCRLLHTKRRR